MKDVTQLSKGGALRPAPDAPDAPPSPGSNTLTAPDFRYDKTGLPRYADAVSGVASAYTYGPAGEQDVKGSSVEIVTTSSFDTAVQWYVKNLPGGWHAQTVGDFGGLAQQLSVQSLTKMLGGAGDDPAASAPAPAAGLRIKVSVFTPPQGAANDPGVLIVQKDQDSVKVLMKVSMR